MPVIHSDCAGSKAEPRLFDWGTHIGVCAVCGKRARLFKDREGVVVMWPHEGEDL